MAGNLSTWSEIIFSSCSNCQRDFPLKSSLMGEEAPGPFSQFSSLTVIFISANTNNISSLTPPSVNSFLSMVFYSTTATLPPSPLSTSSDEGP
ncbi:hypothetical protein Fmac_001968 [Flemingia macrophylla]|uniref:Uncharacterized protein n=1 Tax=Flemingia macrophylla TaxID=520843 RepID=A0ABD1NIK8_9FABA